MKKVALILAGLLALSGCAAGGRSEGPAFEETMPEEGIEHVWDQVTAALFQDRTDLLARVDKTSLGNEAFETLMAAIGSGDGEPVCDLFSPNAKDGITDLPGEVEALLAFFDGPVSTQKRLGSNSTMSNEYGVKVCEWQYSYRVTTSKSIYRVELYAVTDDDTDPDNVGMYKIEVCDEKKRGEGSSFVIEYTQAESK